MGKSHGSELSLFLFFFVRAEDEMYHSFYDSTFELPILRGGVFVRVEFSDEGKIRGNGGVHSRDIIAQRMLHIPQAYLYVSETLLCVPYPVIVISELDASI